MSKRAKRTDLICERGENLVKNRFFEILQWIPRKDHPDDGIDLNVEIPSEDERPSERFLVQVKTASAIKPLRNNYWSASIDNAAALKYLRSRHAVFLFRVDLKTEEIRWIDLLHVLLKEPERRTCSLPPSQRLDADSAKIFRDAVRQAIQAQDDRHHPPKSALKYREQQLEAKDSRFTVQGEIVGGREQYRFIAKKDFRARVKVVPRTKRDARRLVEAHDFGSKAEIKLKSYRIEGAPVFEREGSSDSTMRIEPHARKFRMAVTSFTNAEPQEKSHIEMNAEMSRGFRGWELRSADPECPLEIALRLDKTDDGKNKFEVNIVYERWNGRAFTQLPILPQLLALARCFADRGQVIFEWIEFGERRQILTTTVQADRTLRFKHTVNHLQFLSQVADVCREIGSDARFSSRDVLEPSQLESFSAAYRLTRGESVPLDGFEPTLTPTARGLQALRESPSSTVQVKMPMLLTLGETVVGELPIQATIEKFSFSENVDGTVTLRPKSSIEMRLDMVSLPGKNLQEA
jgi:hypothetical protein